MSPARGGATLQHTATAATHITRFVSVAVLRFITITSVKWSVGGRRGGEKCFGYPSMSDFRLP